MIKKPLCKAVVAALGLAIAGEAAAVEWNVSVWGKRRAFTEHIEKMAELVSQKTNGEFTLNISYGGLSKNKENLDGISIGAFEMAQFCTGYHPDKNPTLTVLELPFLGVDTLEKETRLSKAVYQHPAVQADLARWNATLLMPTPMPQYNFVGKGKAPETLADFNGMAVRAVGGIGSAMQSLGAVPSSMSATEVRQAMDSGIVSAVSFAPHAHLSYGTVDVGEWWTTNLNPGTLNCPVVVNSDALADLSEAHRAALLGSVDESLEHYLAFYNGNTMARWWPKLEEKGIAQITFNEAALADLRDQVAEPVAQAWIKDMEAKGLPGRELLELVKSELAK